MKTIDLTCAYCGAAVQKPLNEYKRQIKSGSTRFFCNLSCATFTRNKENPPKGNISNLINKIDEYSQFKSYVQRAKFRSKNKYNYDITVEYLKKLWEEQKGICPFTKWDLILPKNSNIGFEASLPENASLDRIDNSKGYIEGNVRFISYMANLARQSFSDEQLIEFCKAVSDEKNNV